MCHVAPSGQVLALVLAGVSGGGVVEEVRMFTSFCRVSKEWNIAATKELRRRVHRAKQDPAFRKFLLAEVLKFDGSAVLEFINAMGIQQFLKPEDLFEYRPFNPGWPGHFTTLETIAEHLKVAFDIEHFRSYRPGFLFRRLQTNMMWVYQGVAIALFPSFLEDMHRMREELIARSPWESDYLEAWMLGRFVGIMETASVFK